MAESQPSNERWLPVVGYEGIYEVSDHGRVRSVDRVVLTASGTRSYKGKILRIVSRHHGYPGVSLRRPGVRKTGYIHRLVLEAFVGPCPEGMEGCHNDGTASNNRLSNLRWDTSIANAQDKARHGTNYGLNLTHCPFGHSLDAPNVRAYRARNGRRGCLACARAHAYIYRHPHLKPRFQQVSDDYYARITA